MEFLVCQQSLPLEFDTAVELKFEDIKVSFDVIE